VVRHGEVQQLVYDDVISDGTIHAEKLRIEV
jgi:hypothetical protein